MWCSPSGSSALPNLSFSVPDPFSHHGHTRKRCWWRQRLERFPLRFKQSAGMFSLCDISLIFTVLKKICTCWISALKTHLRIFVLYILLAPHVQQWLSEKFWAAFFLFLLEIMKSNNLLLLFEFLKEICGTWKGKIYWVD